MEFNTRLLHGGFGADKATGATLAPIYQVSAFAQESAEKLEAVFNNRAPGIRVFQDQQSDGGVV